MGYMYSIFSYGIQPVNRGIAQNTCPHFSGVSFLAHARPWGKDLRMRVIELVFLVRYISIPVDQFVVFVFDFDGNIFELPVSRIIYWIVDKQIVLRTRIGCLAKS